MEKKCCPRFNPKPWDGKTHRWKNKLFVKDTLPQFFHIPFPWKIGKMMTRIWKKAQDAGASPDLKHFIWLAYDPSPWKSEHYIHVTKKLPGEKNVKISGTFITKVFDGPYNKVPKYIKEMDEYLTKKGKKAKKYYFYFTTCPKCAKKFGHNYIVAFAQV
jgi:hypothetical protein